MGMYKCAYKKARDRIKNMPTAKLIKERKGYNAEFKRYSLIELKKRGAVKTRKKKVSAFGFPNGFKGFGL